MYAEEIGVRGLMRFYDLVALVTAVVVASGVVAPGVKYSTYGLVVWGLGVATSTEYGLEVVSRDSICSFLLSQYTDLGGGAGCCRESPVAEPYVCYTSTNLLAEYVLRYVCDRPDVADRIRTFLEEYPTDFYDYYQVLLGKPIELPFMTIEHVEVGRVGNISVRHVVRSNPIYDYDHYANLLAIKVVYHSSRGELSEARLELVRLSKLYDGVGFADRSYMFLGVYETYKLALAVIAHRVLGYLTEAEEYVSKLTSIKPLATLYHGNTGIGDLNVETATLVAIALYSATSQYLAPTSAEQVAQVAIDITPLLTLVVAVCLIVLHRKLRRRH